MLSQRNFSRQFYHCAIVFWLFQERLKPSETADSAISSGKVQDFSRIRCPSCRWQPNASSRWYCGDCDYPEYFFKGCGTAWNTFATQGRCPGCGHQWRWTVCLRCFRWSHHEQWYENKNQSP